MSNRHHQAEENEYSDASSEFENELEQESNSKGFIGLIKRNVPMFMLSLAIHSLILLIIALIPGREIEKDPEITVIVEFVEKEDIEEPEEIKEIVFDPTEVEVNTEITEEEVVEEEIEVEEFEEESENEDEMMELLDNMTDIDSNSLSNMPMGAVGFAAGGGGMPSGGMLGGRSNAGFRRKAGGALNQKIIDSALKYLASTQLEEGRWEGKHINATSSAAVLAFLGNGNSTSLGPYKHVVTKYVDFYIKNQRPDGSYGNHGHATPFVVMAMCDAFAMDPSHQGLMNFCKKAVAYIQNTQNASGGWNGGKRTAGTGSKDVDIAQTAWYVMALFSAKLAGLDIPKESILKVNRLFKKISDGTFNGKVLCTGHGGMEDEFTRKYAAQSYIGTVLQFTGSSNKDQDVINSSKYLIENSSTPDKQNFWLLYNQGLGIFQLGQKNKIWNHFKTNTLAKIGKTAISENGMIHWENHRKFSQAKNKTSDTAAATIYWGHNGATAMAVLNLQVFYRYASLEDF